MISVYKCLDRSSKPISTKTIDEIVGQIKNPPKKIKDQIETLRNHGKDIGITKPKIDGDFLVFDAKQPIKIYNKSILIGDFTNGSGSIKWDEKSYYDVTYGDSYAKKSTLKVDMTWNRDLKIQEPEVRSLYDHIKRTQIPSVTWNCQISEVRRISDISQVSNYIYVDVDDYLKTIEFFKNSNTPNKCSTIEKAKEHIWSVLTNIGIPYITHAWRSIGFGGFGALVYCEGLTVENFRDTWLELERILASKGVFIDPATKDITRPNVLSYDPNIFIRSEKIVPFQAVNISKEIVNSKEIIISKENAIPVVSKILGNLLSNEDNHNLSEERLAYTFYQKYFSLCCDGGIDFKTAYDYLIVQSDENPILVGHRNNVEIKAIGEKQYSYFGRTFGKRKFLKNITYNGESSLKIQWIVYKTARGRKPNADEILRIIKTCKYVGILKTDLLNEIFNKDWFSNEVYNSLEGIYSNEKHPFGVDGGMSDEKFDQLKQQYIGRLKSYGYTPIEVNSFEGDLSEVLEETLQATRNIVGELSEENIFKYCTYFFEQIMSYAIEAEDSLEFFISKEDKKFKGMIEFLSGEIYNDYCWKFGIRKVKKLSKEKILGYHNIEKTYYLPNNQHISDLNIEVPDYSIIWGNTGQGKTTWICDKMKNRRLILLPIKSAVRSIQIEYGASVFYEDEKNVKDGDNLIACTYSSFPKLFAIMQGWQYDVKQYELYFDESHNYAVSASPEYRGYELNFIAENMRHFKKRALFTGTLIKVLHPIFDLFKVIRVNWEKTPIKPFWRVKYEDIRWSISTLIDRSGKNIIYLQNKKMDKDLGMLIETLKGRGISKDAIACINADEKSSDSFQKIINEHLIDDKIKVIICTSVIVEALSINNSDIRTIHFYTHESPHLMEQMVNRFRKIFTSFDSKSDCKIYIYEKNGNKSQKFLTDDLDIVELQKTFIKDAQYRIKYLSKPYTSGDSLSQKISSRKFMQDIFEKSGYFRVDDTKKWSVDYLSIANKAFLEEKRHCYANIDYMCLLLSEYNWQFMGDIVHESKLSSVEIKAIKEFKDEQQEILNAAGNAIIETIKGEGEDICIENINDDNVAQYDNVPFKDMQIDLRSKVKWLCNYIDFKDAVRVTEDWINKYNFSDRIFKKVVRQVNVMGLEQIGNILKHQNMLDKFSVAMQEFYFYAKEQQEKNGYFDLPYLKTILKDKLVKFNKMSKKDADNISDTLSLDIYNLFFETIGVPDDKGKVFYKVAGLHLHNDVYTFDKMFKKWIKLRLEDGKHFTSKQLADLINDCRVKLPLLKDYKLSPASALKLLADYCTVKQKSKITENGKRVNTYCIESDIPEELGDVRLNVFRKLDIRDIHIDDLTETQKEYLFKTYQPKELIYFLQMKEIPSKEMVAAN